METKSTFTIALKPALIISMAVIAYSLVVWALTSSIDQQKYFGWVSYLFIIAGYIYFTISYRNDIKGGSLTYGEGFLFMVILTAIYSVIQGAYFYVFITIIDPTMIPQMLEQAELEMLNKGIPEEQLDQSMKYVGYMFQPWLLSIFGILGNLFWLTIGSLIMAIFTKKEEQATFDNI